MSNNRGGSSGGTKQKYCNLVIFDIHSMKLTVVSFAPEKIWMLGIGFLLGFRHICRGELLVLGSVSLLGEWRSIPWCLLVFQNMYIR